MTLQCVSRGPGYAEYMAEFPEAVPRDFPGLGLPAYLLSPVRRELQARHPGWHLQRATRAAWNKAALLLVDRRPWPTRCPSPDPTPMEVIDHRTLTYTVVWERRGVAEVAMANGYHYITPTTDLDPRRRNEHLRVAHHRDRPGRPGVPPQV